jgi:hypothetical protein
MQLGPFTDPDDVKPEDVIVPCPCEGTPHKTDTVYIKSYLNGAEVAEIKGAAFYVSDEGRPAADPAKGNLKMMEIGVIGWTFTDKNGEPIKFRKALINRMRGDIWLKVNSALDAKTDEAVLPLESPPTDTGTSDTTAEESSTIKPDTREWSPSSSTSLGSASGTSSPS